MSDILVIAKSPRPGSSKTRLCPPFTPDQAAQLAEAALVDTLEAVSSTPADRRVLVLDGDPGPWAEGFDVIAQRGTGLAQRLDAAFADAFDGRPMLLVGMDTPQVTPRLMRDALQLLAEESAVFGAAEDGGWWCLGLPRPVPGLFDGVPMSTPQTASHQRAALERTGVAYRELEVLRDIDVAADADAVARAFPHLGFSRALASMNGRPS